MADLKTKPLYRLTYKEVVGESTIVKYFYFNSLIDIKKFLKCLYVAVSYNTECILEELRIRFTTALMLVYYNETPKLEDITAERYILNITSTGAQVFYFDTLSQLKNFVRHFNNGGGTWTYTASKQIFYFNKNNNYVISSATESVVL